MHDNSQALEKFVSELGETIASRGRASTRRFVNSKTEDDRGGRSEKEHIRKNRPERRDGEQDAAGCPTHEHLSHDHP